MTTTTAHLGKPVPSSVLHIWFPTSTSWILFRLPFLALFSRILRVLAAGAEQAWRHRSSGPFLDLSLSTDWGLAFWALLERLRRDIPIVVVCCWAMDGGAAGLVGPRTAQRRFPCSFFCYLVYFAVASFSSWGISVGKHLSGDGIGFAGWTLFYAGEEEGIGMTWPLVAVVVVVVAFIADGIFIARGDAKRRKGGSAT